MDNVKFFNLMCFFINLCKIILKYIADFLKSIISKKYVSLIFSSMYQCLKGKADDIVFCGLLISSHCLIILITFSSAVTISVILSSAAWSYFSFVFINDFISSAFTSLLFLKSVFCFLVVRFRIYTQNIFNFLVSHNAT